MNYIHLHQQSYCMLLSNYRNSSIYAVKVGTHKKTDESKNLVNHDYLVVLKGRKIELNYKSR